MRAMGKLLAEAVRSKVLDEGIPMPFCRSSAWINQLQRFFSSSYATTAKPQIKADERSLVMHGERKQVGIRDLPVLEKCFCLKDSSCLPRKRVSPKEVVRMRKQPLK